MTHEWTPGGSQTRSKSLAAYGLEGLIGSPWDSEGATFRTADGSCYIDWVCGLGAISLGYRRPEVVKAIEEQLHCGTLFSIPHRLEEQVAGDLCAALRWPEQVRWVKTGSEATEAAIRIARRATGRDVILTVGTGYHSWHSWFQAVKPEHPGVPAHYGKMVFPFAYNNLEDLQRWFDGYGGLHIVDNVAAVIMEPTLVESPEPGFLEGVRTLCSQRGSVLIFDEMVLGFRLAVGGGSEYFCVQPDLACYGKGLGNGMPVACVVGKRDLLQYADVVSGTFGGECLSLAAAKAVLDVYAKQDVCGHMRMIGHQLNGSLRDRSQDIFGLAVEVEGWPPVCKYRWPYSLGQEEKMLGLFTQQMAQRGILWHPRIRYVSAAHTEVHVRQTVEAAQEAFAVVRKALHTGDWSALKGEPPAQTFARGPHT